MRQVLRPGTLGRPRGTRWRGRWEGGSGWGIHVTPWLIHVNVWQKPLQYCKIISLQLKKKKKKKKPRRGCGEKGTLLHCWWECKLVQPLWRKVWRFLKRLKIELPYDPSTSLLGIYPEKLYSKRYMHLNVHSRTIYNTQNMEATKMSINKWMDKEDMVHITQWNITQPFYFIIFNFFVFYFIYFIFYLFFSLIIYFFHLFLLVGG